MTLPSPETMLTYASILEKPQYHIDKNGLKWLLPTGEIIEAACEALRVCAPWQPIESVQKNGLKVDLWCLNISDGRSTRFSGMFVNHDGKWEDLHGYILEPKWRPVYWTPIPAPPALPSTPGQAIEKTNGGAS